MISNWNKSFNLVVQSEGGFSDDIRDPGNRLPDGRSGCTMWGCTQTNWEAYVGHKVTHDDMRALTKEDVKPLYKAKYWDAVAGDQLPLGVDYAAFDFAINAGPKQCRILMQRALGVADDGAFGPRTLGAIQAANKTDLLHKFSAVKIEFYKALDNFPTYGKGWLNRVENVEKVASTM